MSYLTFPDLTGQTNTGLLWGWPIKRTPRFNTIIQKSASGRGELRIPLMQFPLFDYDVSVSYLIGDTSLANWRQSTGYQVLVDFLIGVQGQGNAFLYSDPYGYQVPSASPQVIATGDGSTLQFVMALTLVSGGAFELIQNFQAPPVIYVNGSPVSNTTYSIDAYGTLTFNAGHAPGAGQSVAWSGNYYRLCRLSEDTWTDLTETMYQVWDLKTLKFETILL